MEKMFNGVERMDLFAQELLSQISSGKTETVSKIIEEMEKNIAAALQIDVSQVNVKATTEEGLGFTGTEQGISSQAICALTTIYENSMMVADSQAGCAGKGSR